MAPHMPSVGTLKPRAPAALNKVVVVVLVVPRGQWARSRDVLLLMAHIRKKLLAKNKNMLVCSVPIEPHPEPKAQAWGGTVYTDPFRWASFKDIATACMHAWARIHFSLQLRYGFSDVISDTRHLLSVMWRISYVVSSRPLWAQAQHQGKKSYFSLSDNPPGYRNGKGVFRSGD